MSRLPGDTGNALRKQPIGKFRRKGRRMDRGRRWKGRRRERANKRGKKEGELAKSRKGKGGEGERK